MVTFLSLHFACWKLIFGRFSEEKVAVIFFYTSYEVLDGPCPEPNQNMIALNQLTTTCEANKQNTKKGIQD